MWFDAIEKIIRYNGNIYVKIRSCGYYNKCCFSKNTFRSKKETCINYCNKPNGIKDFLDCNEDFVFEIITEEELNDIRYEIQLLENKQIKYKKLLLLLSGEENNAKNN